MTILDRIKFVLKGGDYPEITGKHGNTISNSSVGVWDFGGADIKGGTQLPPEYIVDPNDCTIGDILQVVEDEEDPENQVFINTPIPQQGLHYKWLTGLLTAESDGNGTPTFSFVEHFSNLSSYTIGQYEDELWRVQSDDLLGIDITKVQFTQNFQVQPAIGGNIAFSNLTMNTVDNITGSIPFSFFQYNASGALLTAVNIGTTENQIKFRGIIDIKIFDD